MVTAGVEDDVSKGSPAYWRDLLFSRFLPAVFFSIFLVRQLLFVWDGVQSLRTVDDYLFLVRQVLALAYFTMLVVLYSVRLPKRGTDQRLGVVFIAFTGTFSVVAAVGINLATAGWLGALAVVFFIICELLRIRWEEGVLSRTFPAEYPVYARRVPRYAPNPLR